MLKDQQKEVQVSVFILAHNQEKYIQRCIDGVISQKTNFKFEIIIHDDASTDNTVNIIRRYASEYPDIIFPIYQSENQWTQGIQIFMAHMYPYARGKYIAFCDGDDYWIDTNKLQKQFNALEENIECSICVCAIQDINEDGSYRQEIRPYKELGLQEGILSRDEVSRVIWGGVDQQDFISRRAAILSKET